MSVPISTPFPHLFLHAVTIPSPLPCVLLCPHPTPSPHGPKTTCCSNKHKSNMWKLNVIHKTSTKHTSMNDRKHSGSIANAKSKTRVSYTLHDYEVSNSLSVYVQLYPLTCKCTQEHKVIQMSRLSTEFYILWECTHFTDQMPCSWALSFQTSYAQRHSRHIVQSVHLAAGHVIKSFTAFSGAQVSSSRVSAIMQSCLWLSGISISRVSGLSL